MDSVSSFAQARASGIRGVILKATQRVNFVDSAFVTRRANAAAAGLRVGAYHFLGDADGMAQAQHFLSVVGDTTDLLLALDWEEDETSHAFATVNETRICAQTVHDAVGRWPMLYASPSWIDEHLGSTADPVLGQCPLWLANYASNPHMPRNRTWTQWTLWQYTSSGTVPGIGTRCVDRSVFDGTEDQLLALWDDLSGGANTQGEIAGMDDIKVQVLPGADHVVMGKLDQAAGKTWVPLSEFVAQLKAQGIVAPGVIVSYSPSDGKVYVKPNTA